MRDISNKANARAKLKQARSLLSENERYERGGEADDHDVLVDAVLDEVVHGGKGFARSARRAMR